MTLSAVATSTLVGDDVPESLDCHPAGPYSAGKFGAGVQSRRPGSLQANRAGTTTTETP